MWLEPTKDNIVLIPLAHAFIILDLNKVEPLLGHCSAEWIEIPHQIVFMAYPILHCQSTLRDAKELQRIYIFTLFGTCSSLTHNLVPTIWPLPWFLIHSSAHCTHPLLLNLDNKMSRQALVSCCGYCCSSQLTNKHGLLLLLPLTPSQKAETQYPKP